MTKKLFVPLDIETTGLDPHSDMILEIAWVVTDDKLTPVTEPRSFIVEHGEDWQQAFSLIRSNEFVRRMHEDSGLADALMSTSAYGLEEISEVLNLDIRSAGGGDHSAHLLGFSVDFDRQFLKGEPATSWLFHEDHGAFHHRVYDLSSVKLAYEISGLTAPEIENTGKHRAGYDMLEALEFAQAISIDFGGVA